MEYGNLVYDIYWVCRRLFKVEFIVVSYNINNIATTLAKFVLLESKSDSWEENSPRCIASLIKSDDNFFFI